MNETTRARFRAEKMGDGDPYPGMWGVRDGDEWRIVGDEADRYPMQHSAEQAARSLGYVARMT
ncbi:hypothetical protein KNE206_18670 [Kitasatospora sp. NE20-6]|uniref:hypothetical protein n=1 Tax=Kitasatospora sp. NE20-6 TaxID=2859066 RepID=UPI0034DBA867